MIFFVALLHFSLFYLAKTDSEDQLDVSQGCGESGQLFDAPIPRVYQYQSKRGRRSLVADKSKLWPNGVIPYVLGPGLSASGKRLIRGAMDLWEKSTCIRFAKRTKERDYVYLFKGQGCCSHVGRLRGKQTLSLGLGCLRHGIIVHELGHAIGFWHEQNRPDRGSFVDILYNNVEVGKSINFDLIDEGKVQTLDQDYDYRSIMHYGSNFFNRNGYHTIRPKAFYRIDPNVIGSQYFSYDGNVLSQMDILKANIMYKCTKLEECGGTTFKGNGQIEVSGRSFGQKRKEKSCVWVVNRNETSRSHRYAQTLTLIFEEFKVGHQDQNTGNCDRDYVEIREGKGFFSPFFATLCGHSIPEPITTLSESLYIKLYTANEITGLEESLPNFRIRYKQDECSKTYVGLSDTIESIGFPASYPIDADCLWKIKLMEGYRIVIRFHSFDLRSHNSVHECADYLDLLENGKETVFKGRYCGSHSPEEVRFNSNEATIHLHTTKEKYQDNAAGFSASYHAEDIDECETGQHHCDLKCLNSIGGYYCACLRGYMPGEAKDMPNASCLDIDECATNNGGCSHECVNTDGSYFCTCPPGHVIAANNSCVDVNECRPPFNYCSHNCHNTVGSYHCSCPTGFVLQTDMKTCKELSYCLGHSSSLIGTIQSPDIPTSNTNEVNCRWTININKHYGLVLSFHLPWKNNVNCKSYLILKSKRNGTQKPREMKICSKSDLTEEIDLKCSSVTLEYHAEKPYLPRFMMRYRSIRLLPDICGAEFTVQTGYIKTPGYPYRYPSKANCVWKIRGSRGFRTKIEFLDFKIEFSRNCLYDYLEIEEYNTGQSVAKRIGRFCGYNSPPDIVISSYNDILLKFVSDATVRKKGVHLRFSKF